MVWHAWQPMLVKTWLPRVTVAVDVVDDCAAGDPAAAVITPEASAVADPISVEVVDEELVDPVVWVTGVDPVVCATGVALDVAGVGGAVRRMKAENSSMSFW